MLMSRFFKIFETVYERLNIACDPLKNLEYHYSFFIECGLRIPPRLEVPIKSDTYAQHVVTTRFLSILDRNQTLWYRKKE